MLGNRWAGGLRRRAASLPRLLDQFVTSGSLDNAREEMRRAEHRHALREVLADHAARPQAPEEDERATI